MAHGSGRHDSGEIMRKCQDTWHIRQVIRPSLPHTFPFMTLLSTAQHIARDTRKDPRGHMVLIVVAATTHRRRHSAGRLFAVADLGRRSCRRSGAVAGQRRRHAVQRADVGDPPQNPAPFRSAGARRSQLRLPLARGPRSAEACQRRYGRGKRAAADRPDLPVDHQPITTRWRPTPGSAPSIRATSIRPRRRSTTA